MKLPAKEPPSSAVPLIGVARAGTGGAAAGAAGGGIGHTGARGNRMVWLLEVDGFPVDARQLPAEMQVRAWRQGLIPYPTTS